MREIRACQQCKMTLVSSEGSSVVMVIVLPGAIDPITPCEECSEIIKNKHRFITKPREGVEYMEPIFFNKNDEVPQWIEKTENVTLKFGVPVRIELGADGVHVYPLEEGTVMKGTSYDKDAVTKVIGAPTTIHYFGNNDRPLPFTMN